MKRGPGKLVALFNALRDFVLQERVIPGQGLVVRETVRGRMLGVDPTLVELGRKYEESLAKAPAGGSSPSNPFTGGSGGTGLPDTGTDEEGNPTSPNGDPLGWRTLNVCVDDGAGGYTPAQIQVYAGMS